MEIPPMSPRFLLQHPSATHTIWPCLSLCVKAPFFGGKVKEEEEIHVKLKSDQGNLTSGIQRLGKKIVYYFLSPAFFFPLKNDVL